MRHAAIANYLVVLSILTLGLADTAHGMPTQLSAAEKNDLRQAVIAIIGPYRQTAELGPPLQTDESIGFGAAIAASKNDSGDVRAVVGAPSADSQRGAAYVFTRMHGTTFWHQQLIASGEASLDQFGAAVTIDGDTVAVGAPGHDNAGAKGAAYVYVYDSGSDKWTQQGTTFIGANAYGTSVALSGNTLAIGAPKFGAGSVGIYSRSAGVWSFSSSVTPPDSPPSAQFGKTLAMDDQHLLVGAPQDSSIAHQNLRGSAYMFALDTSAGHYKFQQKLIAGLDGAANDTFGSSVALNGNIAVIGIPGRSSSQGAVNSFRFDGSVWVPQPTLAASGGAMNDAFGSSVAVGTGTLAVGARFTNTNAGSLYTFNGGPCAGGTPCLWTPTIIGGSLANETGDRLGSSSALAGDTLLVGAPQYDLPAPGYVLPLSFDGHRWNAQQRIAPLGADKVAFGEAVAISGNRAIVAADSRAILFERSADGSWAPQATFAQNGCPAVAIDGDTVVIGLANTTVTSIGRGIASVYIKSGSGWAKQQDLSYPLGRPVDLFGCGVAISGNTIVVGAPGRNFDTGAAYVFARSGSTWSMKAQISASDGLSSDAFGGSVASTGDLILIGAPDHGSDAAGAVYLFVRSGSAWLQREELNGEAAGDNFGDAIAAGNNTIVIGAPLHDGGKGRSYIYTGSGSSWSLQKALDAPTPIAGGHFGGGIALSGDHIVVGENGNAAAHVFTRKGATWSLRASLGSGSGSEFGNAVGLSNTTVLVGAPGAATSGRAYIFDESDVIFANGFN